ncbi:MAG: FMN-binding protein [Verrucomicrobiales bacterium]
MMRFALPALRLAILCGIAFLLRAQHQWFEAQREPGATLAQARAFFPGAARLSPHDPESGAQAALGEGGEVLGMVLTTEPAAGDVIGYSGPTHSLIALDKDGRVIGARMLRSFDTEAHAADVEADAAFWESFLGLEMGAPGDPEVDAVSGSTLTSAAAAQGILRRLGGGRPSFLFPEPITLEETQALVPGAAALRPGDSPPGALDVLGSAGERIGVVLRTAPASDAVIGYKGPSDVLVALDAAGERLTGALIRKSFDTPDYVGYVRDEPAYLQSFAGKSVAEMASIDFEKEGVEGVSGATITSWALAESMRVRLAQVAADRAGGGAGVPAWRPAARDLGIAGVLLGALAMAFSPLRGKAWARTLWRIGLIGYLGFASGDLLSLALFAGWAGAGVPWASLAGLVLLAAAALLVPLAARRQLYCHHICPHGAAQALLAEWLPWKGWQPPPAAAKWLARLGPALLGFGVLAAMARLPVDLASIEPFDAYLLDAAGWATLAIFIAGLLCSAAVPFAYCRFGCPTGALLRFVRTKGHAERFGARDAWALALLALAATLFAMRESLICFDRLIPPLRVT